MTKDSYDTYMYWLKLQQDSISSSDKSAVKTGIIQDLANSPAYQANALRNGNQQPIIARREKTNISKIIVMPNDEMHIGDLIDVFGEKWICIELFEDIYGVMNGEIWMCNQTFTYQNHQGEVIRKHAIIDDGSYSKNGDKQIPIVDGVRRCYMSLDDESRALYVDKRLALDIVFDKDGQPILEVGKISWIDSKSKNYGAGSHLLYFALSQDVYNKEKDSIDNMICDYTNDKTIIEPDDKPIVENKLVIKGRDSIRIGTTRTYEVVAIDETGNNCELPDNVKWKIEGSDLVSINDAGSSCLITIPLNSDLVGSVLTVTCEDLSSKFLIANKEVVVVSIG